MSPRRRASALAPPADLCVPAPGSTTARAILSRAIGRLLAELRDLAPRLAAAGEARVELVAVAALVKRLLAEDPGALASALRRPTVGTLLRCLRAPRDRAASEALVITLVAQLCAELAFSGALEAPITLTRLPASLLSASTRTAVVISTEVTAATFDGAGVVLHARGGDRRVAAGEGASSYPVIDRELVLALVDNNPLAMEEAHPDKEGNAIDLGGRPASEWTAALGAALSIIAAHLPVLRAEIDLYVHQIVPVGYDEDKHLSASYQPAIGTAYLSLHPSPMTLAEALIHEASHNKLNALFELDEVLENAFSPLYTSPVRPDPRPLHGVLLAVHAFLPVARLYEAMIAAGHPLAAPPSFAERLERIREINREGAEVLLAHARPTAMGRGLCEEIARLVGRGLP